MKMLPSELRELHAHIAKVSEQDVHLGRVLTLLATHLGHAHGLDLEESEKPAEPEAEDEEEETPPAPVSKKGKASGN